MFKYTLEGCTSEYSLLSELHAHDKLHTKKENKNYFKWCSLCIKFINVKSYNRHIFTHPHLLFRNGNSNYTYLLMFIRIYS